MIDKPENSVQCNLGRSRTQELMQKYVRVKVQNDICTSIHIYKLVMCLSTNGERGIEGACIVHIATAWRELLCVCVCVCVCCVCVLCVCVKKSIH